MTHFMGLSMPAKGASCDGKNAVFEQAKRIHTGKEHENVRVTINRPMRSDIRTVPAGKPINWQAMYD